MHGLFGDVLHEIEIRASESSLAMHGGDQNAAQGDVVELLDDVEDRARERAGPSSRDDLALAHIRSNDEMPWKRRSRSGEPFRLFECPRAEHDPRRAFVQQALDRIAASNSAANLHRRGHFGEDVSYDRGVVAAARCRIEIDDVQAIEPRPCPPTGDLDRIVEPHRFVCIRAADELHARTLAKIERGYRDHCAASRRNARTSSTQGIELFSG